MPRHVLHECEVLRFKDCKLYKLDIFVAFLADSSLGCRWRPYSPVVIVS